MVVIVRMSIAAVMMMTMVMTVVISNQ
jgi:hypothetical protein